MYLEPELEKGKKIDYFVLFVIPLYTIH